ncbi:NYN domain-containing protein [Nocardioides acrostichi]|uniref:NYN domain-containing protein n=1 Tax=Nocardioides acrostichi TaxID=2784339 RepID=A0A930YB25_9ACTN|nr:NYN domain-containing protein [Nocardioides acrostichi]MBF4160089.1 NYN domain-containing protein [Nocardioides acrostichi]
MTQRRTFVLLDGENLDATLGSSVLGRRPHPEERPRWERVSAFIEQQWEQPVTGLFFLNASHGAMPTSFVQALLALDYRPIPLSGSAEEKVVDIGIQRTLDALRDRPDADVVLGSHDADFAEHIAALLDGRRVAQLGFREFTSTQLVMDGVEQFDLEYDVRAFNAELPRVRIIPLADFDPDYFLR